MGYTSARPRHVRSRAVVIGSTPGEQRFCGDMGHGWGIKRDLPSGYVKIAIENDHRNSGFSH